MNYFCTLFNQLYLSRGLTMLKSLERSTCSPYKVYVLAMDGLTEKILLEMNLLNVVVLSLKSFETTDLLSVKSGRTIAEYCWTCTPALIQHCIQIFHIPEITYLDSDLYFFNDPNIFIDEVKSKNKSVLITPHNYTPHYDQSKYSGVYCVQFMYFKSDALGFEVLLDWRSKCIEWCFHRLEDGKLGDQKYLDQWPKDFPRAVHDLVHFGAAAPWNIQKFCLEMKNKKLHLGFQGRWEELVFYHFHSLYILEDKCIFKSAYPFSSEVDTAIYQPYLAELLSFDADLLQKYNMTEVVKSRSLLKVSNYFTVKYKFKLLFWKLFYFWFKLA